MRKFRRPRFSVSLTGYWRQNGKLIPEANVNWKRASGSHKFFYTSKKLMSWLRGIEVNLHSKQTVSIDDLKMNRIWEFEIGSIA